MSCKVTAEVLTGAAGLPAFSSGEGGRFAIVQPLQLTEKQRKEEERGGEEKELIMNQG